jgi:hypothetical protein
MPKLFSSFWLFARELAESPLRREKALTTAKTSRKDVMHDD